LLRHIRFEDSAGRITALQEERLVSMSSMHLAAVRLIITPENWSGRVTIRSGLDGRVVNAGAKLYRKFNNRHLQPISHDVLDDETWVVAGMTLMSGCEIAEAARTMVSRAGVSVELRSKTIAVSAYIAQGLAINAQTGDPLTLEKVTAFHTSRDPALSNCHVAA